MIIVTVFVIIFVFVCFWTLNMIESSKIKKAKPKILEKIFTVNGESVYRYYIIKKYKFLGKEKVDQFLPCFDNIENAKDFIKYAKGIRIIEHIDEIRPYYVVDTVDGRVCGLNICQNPDVSFNQNLFRDYSHGTERFRFLSDFVQVIEDVKEKVYELDYVVSKRFE